MDLTLPTEDDLAYLLSRFLAVDIKAAKASGAAHETNPHVLAWFVGSDGERGAVCSIEFSLLAEAVGALALFPKDVIEDAIRAKQLDGTFGETAFEVMNVLGQVFNRGTQGHVRLSEMQVVCSDEAPVENADDCTNASYALSSSKGVEGLLTLTIV